MSHYRVTYRVSHQRVTHYRVTQYRVSQYRVSQYRVSHNVAVTETRGVTQAKRLV